MGFQSHFVLDQIPSTLQTNLQRFANLGLEVNITELDIRMTTPADATRLARQATQYADVVLGYLDAMHQKQIEDGLDLEKEDEVRAYPY